MRYFLYARKSTESEDRQVQSLDDQLAALRDLAKQRGLSVVEELVESHSAKAPGTRPVFSDMVRRIEGREADGILCWNLNRLFRNPVDSGQLSWMLQTGKLLSILTPEREYQPEDNVVLWAVESGVANQFILDLRRVVARGTQSKLDKGWYPHRAPEGYRNNILDKTIEVDGDRFVLLRRAWDLVLTGAYTVPQVREELTRWGFRTKKTKRCGGGPISRTALYGVFANPFYAGEFLRDGRRYQGAHTAMVSREEYLRVQGLLGRAGHPQPQKLEWAFTGLIRCGLCGSLVTAERKVKHYKRSGMERTYSYYHCAGRKCAPKISVSEEELEAQIGQVLAGCRLEPDFVEWAAKILPRHESQSEAADEAALREAHTALKAADRKRTGLMDMRAEGEISKEEFLKRKKGLDAEAERLSASVRGISERSEREQETFKNVLAFCSTAYERFLTGDARTKREVAHAMGGTLSLTLGKLEIRPHPVMDAIRRLEPVKRGSESQKKGISALPNPVWWAMRDDIRTVLNSGDAAPFRYISAS